ncbi:hypothetical protein HDU67_010395, partial [Dinochytrium kinnereticum]
MDRYFAIQRRREMAVPWDMVVGEGLVLTGRVGGGGDEGVVRKVLPPFVSKEVVSREVVAEAVAAALARGLGVEDAEASVAAMKIGEVGEGGVGVTSKRSIGATMTASPQPMNPFSLLIASLMTSNKFLDDARYSNRWWAKVSEMPLVDVNRAESEFLHVLGYSLAVSPVEYDGWVERMQRFARMIEESERHGDISPSVSPNMPPPMNPAIPGVGNSAVSAAAVAAALAQQRSPRSPYHHAA